MFKFFINGIENKEILLNVKTIEECLKLIEKIYFNEKPMLYHLTNRKGDKIYYSYTIEENQYEGYDMNNLTVYEFEEVI